jgi:hypothetical protein
MPPVINVVAVHVKWITEEKKNCFINKVFMRLEGSLVAIKSEWPLISVVRLWECIVFNGWLFDFMHICASLSQVEFQVQENEGLKFSAGLSTYYSAHSISFIQVSRGY